jgi:hypothetical protein
VDPDYGDEVLLSLKVFPLLGCIVLPPGKAAHFVFVGSNAIDTPVTLVVVQLAQEQMQELQANGYKSGESDLDERGLQAWDSEEVDSMMKEAILDCLDATKNHCYAKQWARTSIDLALLVGHLPHLSCFARRQQ